MRKGSLCGGSNETLHYRMAGAASRRRSAVPVACAAAVLGGVLPLRALGDGALPVARILPPTYRTVPPPSTVSNWDTKVPHGVPTTDVMKTEQCST